MTTPVKRLICVGTGFILATSSMAQIIEHVPDPNPPPPPPFVMSPDLAAWIRSHPGTTCTTNVLWAGQSLAPNQVLCSSEGKYVAHYQPNDGNFVIYKTSDGSAIWSVATTMGVPAANLLPAGTLKMQQDCNFVLYAGSGATAQWSTTTGGTGNQCRIVLENNGDLVLSAREQIPYVPRWSSMSIPHVAEVRTASFEWENGLAKCERINGTLVLKASGFYNCRQFDPGSAQNARIVMKITGPVDTWHAEFSSPGVQGIWNTGDYSNAEKLFSGVHKISTVLYCSDFNADGVFLVDQSSVYCPPAAP